MFVYSTVSVTSLWRCRTTPSSTTKTIWWLYTTEYQRPEVLRLLELRMSCMLKTTFMCFTSTSQGINVWCPSWTRYCKHVRLLPASEFVNFDLKLCKKYDFFKCCSKHLYLCMYSVTNLLTSCPDYRSWADSFKWKPCFGTVCHFQFVLFPCSCPSYL